MSLGHRYFVVEGDAITRIPQKTFHDFLFNEEPTLRAYAGQTLTFAMPICELENRRPTRVIRLDTLQLTVQKDGSLDQDAYLRDVAARLNALDAGATDANKTRAKRSPSISEKAYASILAQLKIS